MIIEKIGKTFDEAANQLTNDLRQKALQHAWPIGLIVNMYVRYLPEDDTFDIQYTPGYKQRIEDLEFGTQNVPPNPVIRPFMNRIEGFVEDYEEQHQESILETMELPD